MLWDTISCSKALKQKVKKKPWHIHWCQGTGLLELECACFTTGAVIQRHAFNCPTLRIAQSSSYIKTLSRPIFSGHRVNVTTKSCPFFRHKGKSNSIAHSKKTCCQIKTIWPTRNLNARVVQRCILLLSELFPREICFGFRNRFIKWTRTWKLDCLPNCQTSTQGFTQLLRLKRQNDTQRCNLQKTGFSVLSAYKCFDLVLKHFSEKKALLVVDCPAIIMLFLLPFFRVRFSVLFCGFCRVFWSLWHVVCAFFHKKHQKIHKDIKKYQNRW